MGKVVAVYLTADEAEKLKKLQAAGKTKKEAISMLLSQRDRTLHEDHDRIIELLEDNPSNGVTGTQGSLDPKSVSDEGWLAKHTYW